MGALTVRSEILRRVMPIPEVLLFSADAPIVMASMAAGVRVLEQPFFYYRHHSENRYAIDPTNMAKVRRRYEMDERMCELLEPMLLTLGVSPKSINALLFPRWTEASRFNLSERGGSRLDAFRIEIRHFRSAYEKPSIGYRLYKSFVLGLALLLPPRQFYRVRDWYAEQDLGRFRKWLFRQT